jgi:hypothetical protein
MIGGEMPVDSSNQDLGFDSLEQTEHVERVFLLKTCTFPSIGIHEPFLDCSLSRSVTPQARRPSGNLQADLPSVARFQRGEPAPGVVHQGGSPSGCDSCCVFRLRPDTSGAGIFQRTGRIGLGPGVLVPRLRHPMVNASSAALLAPAGSFESILIP